MISALSQTKFISSLAFILVCASAAQAEVYRHVDESGNVTYSTTPPVAGAKPAELPKIVKEDFDSRIENLKANTPANCLAHGGIDCGRGVDRDGSVLCLDGFADAELFFSTECSEVRLRPDTIALVDAAGKSVHVKRNMEFKALPKNPIRIDLSVRNLSSIPAKDVIVTFVVANRHAVPARGKNEIPAFGIADYTLSLIELPEKYPPEQLKKTTFNVTCANCTIISGTRGVGGE